MRPASLLTIPAANCVASPTGRRSQRESDLDDCEAVMSNIFKSNPQSSGFRRRLVIVGQRTLIESVCIACGTKIVGSAAETLPQDEADHLLKCAASRVSGMAA